MSLTIVLSGPKVSAAQVRNALASAGFQAQSSDHDHGLTATVTGVDVREAQAFVTVIGDDVDQAHACAASLGWRLRAHHHTPEPPAPSKLDMTLAVMQQQINELRGA